MQTESTQVGRRGPNTSVEKQNQCQTHVHSLHSALFSSDLLIFVFWRMRERTHYIPETRLTVHESLSKLSLWTLRRQVQRGVSSAW